MRAQRAPTAIPLETVSWVCVVGRHQSSSRPGNRPGNREVICVQYPGRWLFPLSCAPSPEGSGLAWHKFEAVLGPWKGEYSSRTYSCRAHQKATHAEQSAPRKERPRQRGPAPRASAAAHDLAPTRCWSFRLKRRGGEMTYLPLFLHHLFL